MLTDKANQVPTLLQVRGVSKAFGSLQAVRSVDCDVAAGSVFGIAGPNGAGKSTFFNVLTGIPYGPDEGTILLDGLPVQGLRGRSIVHAGLRRTFQTEAVFDSLDVLSNVRVSLAYSQHRRPVRWDRAQASEVLELVGLEHQADRLAAELSLFDRKRLMIATAMAGKPRLVLLDEPASGLDPSDQDKLISLLAALNRRGTTLIIIEHVLAVLERLADQMIVMDSGSVIASGRPEVVLVDERVREAYLGPAHR